MLFPRTAVISCQQQQQQLQLQQKPSQAVSCNSETAITAQKRKNITEAATAMTYEDNNKNRRDLTIAPPTWMKFGRRRLLQRLRKWPQLKIVTTTNNNGDKLDPVSLMPVREHPEHSDENMEFWIKHWIKLNTSCTCKRTYHLQPHLSKHY